MIEMAVVSLIWAFSFGLTKNQLAGLDPFFVSAVRLLISFFVLAPFLRLKGLPIATALRLAIGGAVQFGIMYIAYNSAFHFLKAYEVALFTIFTPLYITLIDTFLCRKWTVICLLTAILAVAGAAIVEQASLNESSLSLGFLLVQISNICFAAGLVYYRNLLKKNPELKDQNVFGLLYLGAFLAAALGGLLFSNLETIKMNSSQLITLLYLGAIASGVSFFLWNRGAARVNIGAAAIFNNLKIPLAIGVSLLFFSESANLPALAAGGFFILVALIINETVSSRMTRRQ
jgi:drug/metabolite transporter (DMT)-like permease